MRLIDADALRKNMEFVCMGVMAGTENFNAPLCEIDNAPTIHPEPHWIPVTEEPIPDGEYFVTWTSDIQENPIISIVCRYSEVWDCWELQALGHRDINILAYMPLPEPYKGVTT